MELFKQLCKRGRAKGDGPFNCKRIIKFATVGRTPEEN